MKCAWPVLGELRGERSAARGDFSLRVLPNVSLELVLELGQHGLQDCILFVQLANAVSGRLWEREHHQKEGKMGTVKPLDSCERISSLAE